MNDTLNYSYYPGCSLHASAGEYDLSTRELFKALKIGLRTVGDRTYYPLQNVGVHVVLVLLFYKTKLVTAH